MAAACNQNTIARTIEYAGTGIHTGQTVTLRFLPAEPDSGITFVRTDIDTKPLIHANIDNVVTKLRRTVLASNGVEVETVEHLLAAAAGLGVDNLTIEIDGPEVPGGDGSAQDFVNVLREAGVQQQNSPRIIRNITRVVSFSDGDTSIIALPGNNGLTLSYAMDDHDGQLTSQYVSVTMDDDTFAKQIAPARTFCLMSEAEALRAKGLGKGASYDNTLVVENGEVLHNTLRYKDEFVRHKILDLVGDLFLAGCSLRGRIVATKSGHTANIEFVRRLREMFAEDSGAEDESTMLTIREIENILPHRYPFLLLDRVLQLVPGKSAVGIKNVTRNEEFFEGHFPGLPIMPGVLQIEAMAQLVGVLLLHHQPEGKRKLAMFTGMDEVKFRKMVVPGDQLRLEAKVIKLKSRTGLVSTRALVDGEVVAEGKLKFMMVDPPPDPPD